MSRDLLVMRCDGRGTRFDVRCSADVHGVLEPMLAAVLRTNASDPVTTFTLRRQSDATSPWHVSRDDQLLMGCDRLSEALHGLMVYVTQHVIAARDDVLSVHAAGVALGGAGILLPGSSGSGKTTVCARLLQRGAAYLSDDSIGLGADGRLLGYARPLGFKPGLRDQFAAAGLADLTDLAVDPDQLVWHVPPARLGAAVACEAEPVIVAVPRFVVGAPLRVETLPRHVAAREVVIQAQNLAAFGVGAALDRIGTVVGRCASVAVTYADATEVAATLADLAAAGPGRDPAPHRVYGSGPALSASHVAPAGDVNALCFEEGGVLVRGPSGDVLTIDQVGARIWPLLDGSRSVEAVAAELSATFDAPLAQIRSDVEGWVTQLVEHGFLVRPR